MYLEKVQAKGKVYLYLRQYDGTIEFGTKKVTLYGFGRLDKALKNMREWKENSSFIPDELIEFGCAEEDIEHWITKLNASDAESNEIVENEESDPYSKYSIKEKLFYGDLL